MMSTERQTQWRLMWFTIGMCISIGCSQPRRPTLQSYAEHVISQRPLTEADWARRGWWLYLTENRTGAAASFERATGHPLGQLGQMQLAYDRLTLSASAIPAETCRQNTVVGSIMRGMLQEHAPGQQPCQRGDTPVRLLEMQQMSQTPRLRLQQLSDRARRKKIATAAFKSIPKGFDGTRTGESASGIRVNRIVSNDAVSAIEVKVDGPARVWNQQQVLHRSDDERSQKRWTIRVHPDDAVYVATRLHDNVFFRHLHQTAKADVKRDALSPLATSPGFIDWVDVYLRSHDALMRGHHDRAWRLLKDAPPTSPFQNLRATLWRRMPGMSQQERQDAQINAWSDGRRIAPIRAGVRLAETLRLMGRLVDARRVIREVSDRSPRISDVLAEEIRILWAEDRRIDASRLIPRLLATHPPKCLLYSVRRDMMLDRVSQIDLLVDLHQQCGHPLEASRALRKAHRAPEAFAIANGIDPPTTASRLEAAKALLAMGKPGEARRIAKIGGSFELDRLSLDLHQALSLQRVDASSIRQLVSSHFSHPAAMMLMTARPDWSPFLKLIQSTESAIKEYEKTPRQSGTTRVLDHSILRYGAHGYAIRRVHEILAINSREAAEEFGELGLPADAQPVLIYTRKKDGRRRYADWSTEKNSVSMPGLVSGDYVVAIYVQPAVNNSLIPSRFLSERAYFRDVGRDIFMSRFDVIYPTGSRPTVERLHYAPLPTWSTSPFGDVATFIRKNAERAVAEPRAPAFERFLPSMRIGQGVNFEQERLHVQERVLAQRVSTARFDDWVRQSVGRARGDKAIRRVLSAIRTTFVHDDGLTEFEVNRGLSDGRGHRALALSRALEILDVPHRLLLAQTPGANLGHVFRQIEHYHIPLIELEDGRLIMAGLHRGPMDYLPVGLLGGQSVPVWPATENPTIRPLPRQRRIEDERHVTMRGTWADTGLLTGTIEDRLVGHDAIALGDHLQDLDEPHRLGVIEGLLHQSLPSATLTDLKAIDLSRTADSMTVRYRFQADVGESFKLGMFRRSPGHTYASLPTRTTPLVLSVPVNQIVRIELTSERPMVSRTMRFERKWGNHRHWMHVSGNERVLKVDSRLYIKAGQIAAMVYPSFAAWAQQVDADERLQVSLHRAASGPPPVDRPQAQSTGHPRWSKRPASTHMRTRTHSAGFTATKATP